MLKLNKNKRYLLACSYGPDSMALLDMLEKEGFNFIVAHVNYGVRKEAKQETLDLNYYCAERDIQIEILYAKVPKKDANFEAKARQIRYKFFKEVYDENEVEALLVAQHQDDSLETYFLQRQRGGFVEHYGIKEQTRIFKMNVIRPLLDFSKKDLELYCQTNNVPYSIDQSNFSNTFARNVIRHTIVSKMNAWERQTEINKMRELNLMIGEIYKKLAKVDLSSKNVLLSLAEDELQRALVLMARRIQEDASISASLSKEIKKILNSPKPNVSLKINPKLIFIKEYDFITFHNGEENYVFEYKLEKPKVLDNKYFYLDFTIDASNRNVREEDYPLTIRNALKSDVMVINSYQVEVRRLFIDWKMPASLRKRWPVIVNKDNTIIYIPRYRKEFKMTKGLNFYVKK
ncbi:MAG: tRNA lysidine(34) synthetase TilS [Erysipelotrichia bacterium]|nr:tRNA lysidine(34) synthetase TilS [Erysipelotrichia bacterium]